MSRLVHVDLLLMLLLAACPRARAEAPPPDPARGDSYDGRPHPPGARAMLLLVPRLILSPLRFGFRLLAWPLGHAIDWDDRNHSLATILRAFSSRDGLIGVRPAFQYSISFTPVVGLRFFDRKLLGPTSSVEVTAMTGGLSTLFASAYARPTPADRAYEVNVGAEYERRDDQVFTGIGYATDDPASVERPARYAVDRVDTVGGLELTFAPGVFLGFTSGFGLRRFGDGISIAGEPPISEVYCVADLSGQCRSRTVDEVRVPGFAAGTQFFRTGARLRIDSRDNYYRPSSGGVLELGFDWTHGIGGDASQYLRGHGTLGGVLDLWQRSRSLVARIEANALESLSQAAVPFSELIVLGGPDSFRGFRYGRFRNASSLFAALEYRWSVWMWMDAVAFVEYGGVFGRRFEGFSLTRMRPDVGVGFRLRSSEAFYLRAHAAYGWGDGWQFSISVNTGL
jgi:outer membrane protein assembly factor BamA